MRYENILQTIGRTPLVRLNSLTKGMHAHIYAKIESRNPGLSIKDRVALAMVEAAEKEGRLKPGSTIIEPTSGNTGIGLALVAAVKGYRLILTMPQTMSIERRALLRALGADIVLTPGPAGMTGAIDKAQQLVEGTPGAFMPQQFKNLANPSIHRLTTAKEIWGDTSGKVTHFVAGVGTGGTISGVGRFLKEKKPDIRVIAVEPDDSPVLSGGKPGPHGIQGIGAGFIPDILDRKVIDEVVRVRYDNALATARDLMRKEGMLAGISAGANVWAALSIASKLGKDALVVVILPDAAERYISTDLFKCLRPGKSSLRMA
ncbi:cysteine synthase A [Candidatus Micrarchaeota archaeon]|nr:cysteine synthase A [Candidatus Micrarchaeota archaeon]